MRFLELPLRQSPMYLRTLSLSCTLLGALSLSGCQVTPAAAAKAELAPVPAGLADRLPADTLAFFSLPDIQAMRAGMEKSTLVRIYRDAEVQEFLSGGLQMLDSAWDEIRAEAEANGIPLALTNWEALRSFEVGFALRAAPGATNPFDQAPHMYGLARLGLAPGLGTQAYEAIKGMLGEGAETTSDDGRRTFVLLNEIEEGALLTAQLIGTDDALEFEFTWGGMGEGILSEQDTFRRAWNRNFKPGAAVFAYLHFSELMDTVMAGLRAEEPDVAALLDEFFVRVLQPMESVSFASGWNDDGSFTNSALDLTQGETQDELWTTVPLDASLAAYVPENASSFTISSARGGPWMDLMMRTMDNFGNFQPEGLPMPLSGLLQQQVPELHSWLFGEHRPELDRALASFGTRSFSYVAPTSGLTSESYTFIELGDPAGMAAVLEQLMPRLREALNAMETPVRLDMKRTKRTVTQADGSTAEVPGPAYYWIELDFPAELQQLMGFLGQTFQPCFAVAPEGWLVFSVNLASVRNVLKNGMTKPERSIRENAEAAAFLAGLPKGSHSASWSDPRPATAAAMGMIGGLLPMLGSMIGDNASQIPVDLNSFPSGDAFVRHMRPGESYSYSWLGDMRSSATGSVGFADLFTAFGASVALVPPFLAVARTMQPAELLLGEPSSEPAGEIEF